MSLSSDFQDNDFFIAGTPLGLSLRLGPGESLPGLLLVLDDFFAFDDKGAGGGKSEFLESLLKKTTNNTCN